MWCVADCLPTGCLACRWNYNTNNDELPYPPIPTIQYWTDAHVNSRIFAYAQNQGFMKNFDYISGEV